MLVQSVSVSQASLLLCKALSEKGERKMKYSKEFKDEAIKLSDEIGLKKAAQQLGIQYYTLSDWRSKRNAAIRNKKYQMSDEELKKRNLELERENAELRKANDILTAHCYDNARMESFFATLKKEK